MARLLIEVQFHDDNGDPLTGGKIYFYESGTTTLKTTYVDEAMSIENTNPIVLDANGRCTDGIWYDGAAKLQLRDANDVIIPNGTFDPVYTASSGGSGAGSVGLDDDPWTWYQSSHTYSEYDLVVDPSTRKWYQSTADSNTNNALTDETYWVQIGPIFQWNTEKTFRTNNYAYYSGLLYRSKTDSNLNNNPITSPTNWEALGYQFRHNDEGTITTGNTVTLDLLSYNRFTVTVAASATITVAFSNEANIPDDYVFDIELINGGGSARTINWPSNVRFTRGYEPNWTETGRDVVTLVRYSTGTQDWYAEPYTLAAAVPT